MNTPALKEFWQNLKEVGTLMSHCSNTEKNARQRLINESCARAALLLLCSHLEGFFEKLIVDILGFHKSKNTPLSKLPVQLRCIQAWQGKDIPTSLDFEKKWKLSLEVYLSTFFDDTQSCESVLFKPELHLKGFASPGSSEVEKLFNTVGISKVWDCISNKFGNLRLKTSLNGLVHRRNNVAHGDFADRPTPLEVKLMIKDICALVRGFNDVVVEYLTANFSNQNLWDS